MTSRLDTQRKANSQGVTLAYRKRHQGLCGYLAVYVEILKNVNLGHMKLNFDHRYTVDFFFYVITLFYLHFTK